MAKCKPTLNGIGGERVKSHRKNKKFAIYFSYFFRRPAAPGAARRIKVACLCLCRLATPLPEPFRRTAPEILIHVPSKTIAIAPTYDTENDEYGIWVDVVVL